MQKLIYGGYSAVFVCVHFFDTMYIKYTNYITIDILNKSLAGSGQQNYVAS